MVTASEVFVVAVALKTRSVENRSFLWIQKAE